MFFLLASFMMVSLSQVHMKGIKVTLPTGQSGEVQPKNEYISVSVDASGNPYFDKEEMTYDKLTARLKTVHDENPEAKVFVRGDTSTVHGNIIRVLDILRSVGFYKIAFEIKSEALKGVPAPGVQIPQQ
jgi:biopolymer transport protein ExbD